MAAAANKVALANLEVIGVGDDVAIPNETISKGRGRGRERGRERGRRRSEGAGENQKGVYEFSILFLTNCRQTESFEYLVLFQTLEMSSYYQVFFCIFKFLQFDVELLELCFVC